MTPEIESLAQQLIEAARLWESQLQPPFTDQERQEAWKYLYDFFEELPVPEKEAWKIAARFLRYQRTFAPKNITAVILAFREELKQARRDALEDAAKECDPQHGEGDNWGAHYASCIRALMEKP